MSNVLTPFRVLDSREFGAQRTAVFFLVWICGRPTRQEPEAGSPQRRSASRPVTNGKEATGLALILAHKAFARLPRPGAALSLDKALIRSPPGAMVSATSRIPRSGGGPLYFPAAQQLPACRPLPSAVWRWTVLPAPSFSSTDPARRLPQALCMTTRGR